MECSQPKLIPEESTSNLTTTSPSSSTSDDTVGNDFFGKNPTYPFSGTPVDIFIQSSLNLTSVSELARAVDQCKEMVLDSSEYSEERKWLVRHLVELRLRFEEAREVEPEQSQLRPIGTPDCSPEKRLCELKDCDSYQSRKKRIILGHHFTIQAPATHTSRCDRCCGSIWSMLQMWYQCADCSFRCHMKCLEKIQRPCAYVRVCETPFYCHEICPEVGLAAQEYRCFDCKSLISFRNSWSEPRQCDYDGRYFCSQCHWNDSAVIPARVIHNWDFSERKVCRNCVQFLQIMINRPVMNLDVLNCQLFNFVEQLGKIKKLRSEMLVMKQYLATCPEGLRLKRKNMLIWSLFPHFQEFPTALFTLQDLIDTKRKILLSVLQDVALDCIKHIKRECLVCKGKGFYCEFCNPRIPHPLRDEHILHPFDEGVFLCDKCSTVFHQNCWAKNPSCPRCERLQDRLSLFQEPSD